MHSFYYVRPTISHFVCRLQLRKYLTARLHTPLVPLCKWVSSRAAPPTEYNKLTIYLVHSWSIYSTSTSHVHAYTLSFVRVQTRPNQNQNQASLFLPWAAHLEPNSPSLHILHWRIFWYFFFFLFQTPWLNNTPRRHHTVMHHES